MIINFSSEKYYNGLNNIWVYGPRFKDQPTPPIEECGRFWNPTDFNYQEFHGLSFKDLSWVNRRRCRR